MGAKTRPGKGVFINFAVDGNANLVPAFSIL
jgi:hypothetical protein